MSTQATYDDANLILRLFELRREEKFRKANEWFAANCTPASFEDLLRIAPMGSQENAYFRMVIGYWEMAASFVTSGVLNQDLFFQSNGGLLFVWERVRGVLPGYRAMMKNPSGFHNLETVGSAYVKHVEAGGPEAYAAFQANVQRVAGAGR